MAQVIEHGLVNLLFMARLSDPSLPIGLATSDDFFAEHFRQVMGRLVRAVRVQVKVPTDINLRLTEALRLRNLVVHEFFRERMELFEHQEGRRLMIAELSITIRQLKTLDAQLEDLVLELGAPHGVSEERLAAKVAEMRRAAGPPS